jgi:hypothetical protein
MPTCDTENDTDNGYGFPCFTGSFLHMLWCRQFAVNFPWPTVVLFVRVCEGVGYTLHFFSDDESYSNTSRTNSLLPPG